MADPSIGSFWSKLFAPIAFFPDSNRATIGRRQPVYAMVNSYCRSLTCVRPLMSLQVRALGVHLLATRKLAFVYPALRVGRTVLVTPRVVPVSHGARSCSGARVCVLRACDRGVTIRCDGDQSARKQGKNSFIPTFRSSIFN